MKDKVEAHLTLPVHARSKAIIVLAVVALSISCVAWGCSPKAASDAPKSNGEQSQDAKAGIASATDGEYVDQLAAYSGFPTEGRFVDGVASLPGF